MPWSNNSTDKIIIYTDNNKSCHYLCFSVLGIGLIINATTTARWSYLFEGAVEWFIFNVFTFCIEIIAH